MMNSLLPHGHLQSTSKTMLFYEGVGGIVELTPATLGAEIFW